MAEVFRQPDHRFSTLEEHDDWLVERLASQVTKRDKVFVLGDVAMNRRALARLEAFRCPMDLILGNHDHEKMSEYQKYFNKVHGCVEYKGFLLTHVPPWNFRGFTGSLHGHIHSTDNDRDWETEGL